MRRLIIELIGVASFSVSHVYAVMDSDADARMQVGTDNLDPKMVAKTLWTYPGSFTRSNEDYPGDGLYQPLAAICGQWRGSSFKYSSTNLRRIARMLIKAGAPINPYGDDSAGGNICHQPLLCVMDTTDNTWMRVSPFLVRELANE